MIGGFLGAGKTSAMIRLANYLAAKGLRPGLITNDQSVDLVDTARVRSARFPVQEITGSCFCCNFNGLIRVSELLATEHSPDVLIAEPVGSCTDVRATIGHPLRKLYGTTYQVAPLSVLVDPARFSQFLWPHTGKAFSDKVLYIYGKQLEEADVLVINKIDLLAASQRQLLLNSAQEQFPQTKICGVSCVTGEGLTDWFDYILASQPNNSRAMEVDYDTYAEGEALLGWLNASMRIRGSKKCNGTLFLSDMATEIHKRLSDRGIEIAHLKMTLIPDGSLEIGAVSLTRTNGRIQVTNRLQDVSADGELRINLRAEADPEFLKKHVLLALENSPLTASVCGDIHAFRPGRPNPTHRMAYV
jgi:G3E family GTPase